MGDVPGDRQRVPPAGLYVHVPFCSRVCPYCDFAVLTGAPGRHISFVKHLLREIELWDDSRRSRWTHGPFDTVYLGGGTPSSLEPRHLERILATLRERLPVDTDAVVTLEANPEDVTSDSLDTWRALGVDVLSLGAQAFDDAELRFLGRRHDAETARRSVVLASRASFDTVSVDLIFGLPGQGTRAWRRGLETLVDLGPEHVSCYQLTIQPGTPFGHRADRGELAEMAEPEQAERYELAHRILGNAGYQPYEVSNFARGVAHRSRHNRKYWEHAPYLGLGPSAHSFDGQRRRWWNERRLRDWQALLDQGESPGAGDEILDDGALALETAMLRLRTTDGLDLGGFRARFGIDLVATNRDSIDRWVGAGLVRIDAGRLAATTRGLCVADSLARELRLPTPDSA